MAGAEELIYRAVRSHDLSESNIRIIAALTSSSVRLDYPDLSDEEVDELCSETKRGVKDSNKLVPKWGLRNGRRLNPHQAFAESVSVIAEDIEGTIEAHITFANNASSSTLAGPLERWAKLHREEVHGRNMIEHRIFRIGHPAMSEEVHKQMEKDPSKINPFDVMIGKVADTRDPGQPARAYIWLGETVWRTELEKLGALPVMKKDEETGEPVPDIRDSKPFGDNGRTVEQQTLEIPSLAILMTNIMNIPGAEELIGAASLQQES